MSKLINPLYSNVNLINAKINTILGNPSQKVTELSTDSFNTMQTEIERLNTYINNQYIELNSLDEQLKALDRHANWQHEVITNLELNRETLIKTNKELNEENEHLKNLLQNQNPLAFDNYNNNQNTYNIEKLMLENIKENTEYLHSLISQQQIIIEKANQQINELHLDGVWQLLNPFKATKNTVKNVKNITNSTVTQAKSVIDYVNARPKLKNNLLEVTGLKKLYTNKKLK